MRFTKLRLNGFKSFVDTTDLVIHPGLTGVVGPNGCGKSNLLEALRWVMGENRASAMRGEGMEDVIFAGASTRPARNFAEVALIIDNAERLAPSGFNEADQIEITRRITRDAGSAYKVNTKDVRARDVQMLFADASTGAHSPALVRQGQIAELINAKPKSRRRILEEAAGISGLYQRRHEAELRLNATEQNLARVDDVLEQLAGQLATLARQARQAARYREIGEELRRAEGALLFRRWAEADALRLSTEEALRARIMAAAQAEGQAREAGVLRSRAEAAMPPLREEEAIAGAVLARLTLQRDQLNADEARALAAIADLTGRIAAIARDLDREAGLNRDAGETIQRLEWEQDQLLKAHEGHESRLAEAVEAARQAGAELAGRETALSERTEDMARLSARHQSAQRLMVEAQGGLDRALGEEAKARSAVTQAIAARDTAGAAYATAEQASKAAAKAALDADQALTAAETARAEVQGREAEARAVRSAAEGEANALRAEVAALARLVERESQAGAQVLDLVQVEPGFEAALGAALSDDLRAPLAKGGSGWVALSPYAVDQPLPKAAEPLSQHAKTPDVLHRRLAQIGLVARDQGAGLQAALLPGQRLVSLEGDLWRWDGLTTRAEDAPSAAAMRLRQLNRLVQLKRDLEEVAATAEGARQAHDLLHQRLAELTRADSAARDARRQADQRATETARAASRAEAEQSMAASRAENAELSVLRFVAEAEQAQMRLTEAEAGQKDLPDLEAARAAVEAEKTTVEAARLAMIARRTAQDELRREGEARVRRQQEVTKELSGWRHRLDTAEKRASELGQRRTDSETALATAQKAPAQIATEKAKLVEAIELAETRRAKAADALALGETTLREAQLTEREGERLAGEAREARARAEAQVEASKAGVALAEHRIDEELETDPAGLLAKLGGDPAAMGDVAHLESEVNRLKRQREALGAVNLRAEEDAATVQQEHDTLKQEKLDLEEAIKKLRAGIAGLNREGRERLLTAFEQVNASFATLFTHLFGGGEARLVLVESDDPLEAGLEIMCQPPGKKLSTLSLLSGGEQTLTAMALIFAVFLANPAPICVLDEVDAPLDDANVTRFCDLLDEMTRRTETRFLVITHHAVTMARMDRLFGVTMAEQGVSQLVSVDLTKAAAMVA
ncbi:chromosome segregation protein SMC [Neogemmobacter tilapiae]|uniref:Chromosome partition protein Smc n=1 Tax=Neogemmobacter tilapiae TaxID=875041 RepID=A0A918TXG6_9RHOB|nr:chromosome segregation protein SMC [Gemmobacter tilapiae]GHC64745.1 chromosome partition protein Smc [Gemmobacter tilapiae]